MKVLRFVIGFGLSSLGAVSVACAQQATARSKPAEDRARQEQEVARAHLEHSLHQTEAARAHVERSLRDSKVARAKVECGLQEAAEAHAAADAEAQGILHWHLQDAEKLAVEALRACEVAEHVQEAIARHVDVEAMCSPEMKHDLEALVGQAQVFHVRNGELARVMEGLGLSNGSCSQDSSDTDDDDEDMDDEDEDGDMEEDLEMDRYVHLSGLMESLGRQDRSSQPLKERVRALEERLGIAGEQQGRSLEDRVAELERMTMGGEVRRARTPGESGMPGGLFGRRAGPVPAQPPVEAFPDVPDAPDAPPAQGQGLRGLLGRRGVPAPATPDGPVSAPGHPGHPFAGAEPPHAPEPPATPGPDRFLRRTRGDSAGPSAPREPRASGGSDLTPERRKEVEEVMQRMRGEMERLREEMNRLRDELSSNEGMRSLRGLGYIGGSEGSGGR